MQHSNQVATNLLITFFTLPQHIPLLPKGAVMSDKERSRNSPQKKAAVRRLMIIMGGVPYMTALKEYERLKQEADQEDQANSQIPICVCGHFEYVHDRYGCKVVACDCVYYERKE